MSRQWKFFVVVGEGGGGVLLSGLNRDVLLCRVWNLRNFCLERDINFIACLKRTTLLLAGKAYMLISASVDFRRSEYDATFNNALNKTSGTIC